MKKLLPMEETIGTLTGIFGKKLILREQGCAFPQPMTWPKYLPVYRLLARQYEAQGFGNLLAMETRAMGGLMKLGTLVFTPCSGASVPLLLVDLMAMGKKRIVFVEFYPMHEMDRQGESVRPLEELAGRWKDLPAYPEKDHWYVKERTGYSLIVQGAGPSEEERLSSMLTECVGAYADLCSRAFPVPEEERKERILHLKSFRHRMLTEGNPSSQALERVLGTEGARVFFEESIMPLQAAAAKEAAERSER